MKLIEPSYEIWEQPLGETQEELLNGVYKQIERAGRVCYKSEDKITEDSAPKFVNRLIDAEHYAMLEHGTVYLTCYSGPSPEYFTANATLLYNKYSRNKYSKVNSFNNQLYITTNLRVIVENGWKNDLQYLSQPTEFHRIRKTVHFVLSRQIAMEFLRHRVFSFAMESTRYCNYSKGKFNSELTFIKPCWQYDQTLPYYLETVEANYNALIAKGWQPQQAAITLPNALKAELVMTGFIDDWFHFFNLRALGTTGQPHPQAKQLAEPLMNEFKQLKLI